MQVMLCVFFFKQKTAYEMRISDWSSDVCSSDLLRFHAQAEGSGFAERLYRLRVERGLKQLDIAEKLRVSTAAVSGWESGRSVPRGSRWAELAEYLGVQLAELIGDDSNDLRKLVATSRIDIDRKSTRLNSSH